MNPKQHLIKSNDTESVYKVASFASIKIECLDQFFKKKPNSTLIFRTEKCDMIDLDELRANIPNNYFTQIGFVAKKVDLIKPQECLIDCPLKSVIPKNIKNFRNLISNTVEQYFMNSWKDYLGEKTITSFKQILLDSLSPERGIIIEYEGKPVAVMAIFPHHDCLSREVEQIGWAWIDKNLSLILRRHVRHLLVLWLASLSAQLFQGGIHLHNISAQKFSYKIGFKPKCAHFTLK